MKTNILNLRQGTLEFYKCLEVDLYGFRKSGRNTGKFFSHFWDEKEETHKRFYKVMCKAKSLLEYHRERLLRTTQQDQKQLDDAMQSWRESQISI